MTLDESLSLSELPSRHLSNSFGKYSSDTCCGPGSVLGAAGNPAAEDAFSLGIYGLEGEADLAGGRKKTRML